MADLTETVADSVQELQAYSNRNEAPVFINLDELNAASWRGSHLCSGGCGATVSGNKLACLTCFEQTLREALAPAEEEVKAA